MDLRIKPDIDFSITEREKVVLKAIVDHPGSNATELLAFIPQWTKNTAYIINRAVESLEARRLIEKRGAKRYLREFHPTVKGIKEARK